ncbi:MAG: ABC transporter ATP-binding protein [Acidimicrobiales bacterium]
MTEDGAAAVAVEATETRPDSWIRRLLPYLRAHRRDVVLSFGAALGGLTVTALTPVIQKIVVDDVILARRRPLGLWLGLLVAAGLVRFGAAHVRRYVGGRVALGVQYDLRNDIYTRLQRLDFARHDEFHTGQLVSRASSDVALVQGLLAFLPLFSGNVVLLVASLVIMVALSPLLTVVALLVVPVVTVIALRLRTTVFPAAWDAQQKAAEVAGVVEEAVSGVRVVKGFGQEGQELNRLVGASRALFGSHMRAVRIQAGFTSALQAVPSLGQVAVVAFGGWLALEGRISIGTFLAFSTYLLQLVSPVRMLSSLTVIAQQARAGAERIFELLDSTPVVVEQPDAQDLPRGDGELRFEGVRFGYLRSEPVLDDFTLTIAPNETVALVGPSGSGKSTVALLLPRFYDVQEGTVRIDGVDVRDVSLDSLRRQIGVVFEETFLFSDTVKANIAYGRPDATDAEVESAARAAEAHEFIVALPEGYNTRLGEGGLSLSGGQRQRVALARALLTDPRVLVLDDATSAIDSRVEEGIHATLRRLMSGPVAGRRGLRTTLLVAHRRSTLRLADRIAVVDKGRVVDAGTHEELLARSPLYRLLLAGPGDACDEAVGPELEGDDEVVSDRDGAAGWAPGQVTASAWPAEGDGSQRAARAQASAGPPPEGMLGMHAMGVGGGGGGGGMGGGAASRLALVTETPELREAVAALPPATDDPGVDAGRESEPDPDFRLGRFLRPYRRALAGGLVLVVLDALASLAGPALVRAGIDRGVVDGSRAALWTVTAVFLAVTVADWGVVWAQQRVTGRTAERLLLALRIRIFAHLQRLGLDYYERELSGRIMTRMTTDVEALSQLLQTGLVNAVVSVTTLAGVAVVLAVMNPQLSLVTLSTLVPLAAATVWFRRRSDRAYGTARERIATVNANLQESVSGIRVAQAYARQERNIDDFQRVARDHLDARMTAQRLVATYFPFIELLSVLAAAVVLGVAYRLAATGSLSPGELVAFLLYLNLLFSPIQQLSQVFDTYQQARASLAKIGELLATEPSVRAAYHPVEPGPLRGALRFEGVGFRYAGANEDALSEVNLDVAPGETVALVGETGAGKSTMVKLAARFYDPTEGRVLVDGIPLTDVDLGAYRRQLGYVPQEAFLFSGTIRDNIAYGHPEASDAEVEAAARAVGAHEFIARLSGGYRHVVAERGRSLSAGQRQLIALARAWLVDPAILLLDEATSTLDLATEARVVRAMGVLSSGRTTLIIAHRLQTAQGADRIVVIDKGRVVETGTHEQLLAAGTAGGGVGAPAASEEAGVGAPAGTAKPPADTGTGAYARLWGAFAAAGAATG